MLLLLLGDSSAFYEQKNSAGKKPRCQAEDSLGPQAQDREGPQEEDKSVHQVQTE